MVKIVLYQSIFIICFFTGQNAINGMNFTNSVILSSNQSLEHEANNETINGLYKETDADMNST